MYVWSDSSVRCKSNSDNKGEPGIKTKADNNNVCFFYRFFGQPEITDGITEDNSGKTDKI